MDSENHIKILAAYDAHRERYQDLVSSLSNLLPPLLSTAGVQYHSITCRVKDRKSLSDKVLRPDKSYKSIDEITDIAGVRITSYFADDVDKIASLLEREFTIDKAHSIDKRAVHAPDRFGYLSLHYIVFLSAQRIALSEYRHLSDLRAEIQVRSILQHAWAEIEHDLGYKTGVGIPSSVRRRFARLAGLLELTDLEFSAIRDDLRAYARSTAARIAAGDDDVEIDKASLAEYIKISADVRDCDESLASFAFSGLRPPRADEVGWTVRSLLSAEIRTIREVRQALSTRVASIVRFGRVWAGEGRVEEPISRTDEPLPSGTCLLYLAHMLVAESRSMRRLLQHLERLDMNKNARYAVAEIMFTASGIPPEEWGTD